MELAEAILVALRWMHLLAAVAFVGSAFFSLVLLGSPYKPELAKTIEVPFREVVSLSLAVLLLSGAILTFDRLAGGQASLVYVALLGLKIILGLVMFHAAYRSRGVGPQDLAPRLRSLVVMGSIVLLLSIVVQTIYQAGGLGG